MRLGKGPGMWWHFRDLVSENEMQNWNWKVLVGLMSHTAGAIWLTWSDWGSFKALKLKFFWFSVPQGSYNCFEEKLYCTPVTANRSWQSLLRKEVSNPVSSKSILNKESHTKDAVILKMFQIWFLPFTALLYGSRLLSVYTNIWYPSGTSHSIYSQRTHLHSKPFHLPIPKLAAYFITYKKVN